MRNLFILLLFATLVGSAFSEPAKEPGCSGCDARIQLTRDEFRCFSTEIDQYLLEAAHTPVLFIDVTKCGNKSPSKTMSVTTARSASFGFDPVVTDPPRSGSSIKTSRFYKLSYAQLNCFRSALPKLRRAAKEPIVFEFSSCR